MNIHQPGVQCVLILSSIFNNLPYKIESAHAYELDVKNQIKKNAYE